MTGACACALGGGASAAAALITGAAAAGAAVPPIAKGSGAIENRSEVGFGAASSSRSAVANRDVNGTTLLLALAALAALAAIAPAGARGGSEGRCAGRCGGRMLGEGGITLPRATVEGSGVTSETRPV